MSTMPIRPYLPQRLRATFETWVVRDDKPDQDDNPFIRSSPFATTSEPLVPEIQGTFQIEIRLQRYGKRSVYKAVVGETLQPFAKVFAASNLAACKRFVASQFKKQVTDWEEI